MRSARSSKRGCCASAARSPRAACPSPSLSMRCRPRCRRTPRCWRTSSATGVRMAGCCRVPSCGTPCCPAAASSASSSTHSCGASATARGRSRTQAFAPLLGNLLSGVTARRLLVLPDGPLNGLPFAALPLPHGHARELLIDRFVVSAAPSLALAMHPAARAPAAQTRVAVISDPVYTPDDRRLTLATSDAMNYRGSERMSERLARLPYSAIEARAVIRAFNGTNVIDLAGFNATARLVSELPSADLGCCISPRTRSRAGTLPNNRRCFSASSRPTVRRSPRTG